MAASKAMTYKGKAQSLPEKRLIATPNRADTGARLTNTQKELVGMSKETIAKPTEGASHSFTRASVAHTYQASNNRASSSTNGTCKCSTDSIPRVYCVT